MVQVADVHTDGTVRTQVPYPERYACPCGSNFDKWAHCCNHMRTFCPEFTRKKKRCATNTLPPSPATTGAAPDYGFGDGYGEARIASKSEAHRILVVTLLSNLFADVSVEASVVIPGKVAKTQRQFVHDECYRLGMRCKNLKSGVLVMKG